jgi:hypothetical protein
LWCALACGAEESEGPGERALAPGSATATAGSPQGAIVATPTPDSGAVGAEVTLTASGLPPGASVEIGFGAAQANFEVLGHATVDARGGLVSVVTVPSWAEAGRGYHFVIALVDQPPLALSRPFRVTPR